MKLLREETRIYVHTTEFHGGIKVSADQVSCVGDKEVKWSKINKHGNKEYIGNPRVSEEARKLEEWYGG